MTLPRYAILDMDGTLIDSTGMWEGVSTRVLAKYGRTFPPEDRIRTVTLTIEGTAEFFVREYGLPTDAQILAAEIRAGAQKGYATEVTAKPGVAAALAAMKARGMTLCVASGTEKALVDAALNHLALRQYFDFTLGCENPRGKEEPDIYLLAQRTFGAAKPQEVAVFEDAYPALCTAKKAGFYTVGVKDVYQLARWPDICRIADERCDDWADFAAKL